MLKQQSTHRHVDLLEKHPDSNSTNICSYSLTMLRGEASNTNVII